ncbi:helix-turn-helix transcriptional regulator [Planomonospora sp. ID67723]|uniref:TetR/AcrR family transcriptional regulator n=1 Tax=Planomonospora sp. ID67723 TaxID=2738134 RepID=UPI0018C44DC6|nr:TetR/AcrR family transcriptional regulator [Planomonospora sp. ID67723]MBG0832477.1 helix-turn-helix transcriptional regulator [Planomonospora sp. ID67723]
MNTTGRKLRADAERSIKTIMEAAERVLSENPAATMEQIAEAAGVARTTIHRRFASREALIDIMAVAAWKEIAEAVDAARPATAPPRVAMYQATANVLRVKSGWRFALAQHGPLTGEAARIEAEVTAKSDLVIGRAQQEGVIRPDVDLLWARRVYFAVLTEAAHGSFTGTGPDPDAGIDELATRVVDTVLRGLGPGKD